MMEMMMMMEVDSFLLSPFLGEAKIVMGFH